MAAAALLRSVARKMSRAAAPTHHHRPSLVAARGLHLHLHGGALANSNQTAAASGLGSGAARLTTKPPPPPSYHRLVHSRGIHNRTGTSPDPNPIPSTPVPHTTALDTALDVAANAVAGVGLIALLYAITMHFWIKPEIEELTAKVKRLGNINNTSMDEAIAILKDLRKKSSHLIDISQNMDASSVSHQTPTAPASAGHGNKTEKGTGVIDKLGKEEAVKKMHSHENRIKELENTTMDLEAKIAQLKSRLDSVNT